MGVGLRRRKRIALAGQTCPDLIKCRLSLRDLGLLRAIKQLRQSRVGLGKLRLGSSQILGRHPGGNLGCVSLGLSNGGIGGSDHLGRGSSGNLLIVRLGLVQTHLSLLHTQLQGAGIELGQRLSGLHKITLLHQDGGHRTCPIKCQGDIGSGQHLRIRHHRLGRRLRYDRGHRSCAHARQLAAKGEESSADDQGDYDD